MIRENDPNWTLKTPRTSRRSTRYYAPRARRDHTLVSVAIALIVMVGFIVATLNLM